MSSLSDQLLKAGLVTEEQVTKATKKPKKNKRKSYPQAKKQKAKERKDQKEPSDLAQFYKQRATLEKNEKRDAEKKKQEAAKIKKETNDKINKLIKNNLLNDEKAEIRYNFVVGTTIKYLFVNEKQRQKLAKGELAITFLGGKRALIPNEIADEIRKLNPNKIVVLIEPENNDF